MALLVLALASVLIPTAASALVCGDGILDLLEECDLGAANGASDSCCTSSCMFRPAGEACRPAAGACDAVESCTGLADVCPPDLKSIGVCRPAADVCDVAESCDGQGNDCPVDDFVAAGTVCRPSVGGCDPPETCTGVNALCPPDVKSSGVCRPAVGPCDVAELCDGLTDTCPPDALVPAGLECRPSPGACDPAETCSGTSATCPADANSPAACRPSAGAGGVAASSDWRRTDA